MNSINSRTPSNFNLWKVIKDVNINGLSDLKTDLVHYTSKDAAIKIIRSGVFWMRRLDLMNDSSEISYAVDKVMTDGGFEGIWMRGLLKEIGVNICENTFKLINEKIFQTLNEFKEKTYVFSMMDTRVDFNYKYNEVFGGKLSMWRGYGGDTSVAFVLNPEWIYLITAQEFPISFSKAIYTDFSCISGYDGYVDGLDGARSGSKDNQIDCFRIRKIISDVILSNKENFSRMTHPEIIEYFSKIFIYICSSIKHNGFEEEEEWRLLYHSKYSEGSKNSEYEIIDEKKKENGGTERDIYEIPIFSTGKLHFLNGVNAIKAIVIGPCKDQDEVERNISGEINKKLEKINKESDKIVKEKLPKFYRSDIPFRMKK